MYKLTISALFALTLTSVAHAETPTAPSSIEPGRLATIASLALDDAFEKSTHLGMEFPLLLAGPTTMNCSAAAPTTGTETCVVTAPGTATSALPAALAHN